jgi:predicted transcriptional regulator
MSSSTIENLLPELLLQICELIRGTHPASIRNLSETSHKVRNLAKTVVFQRVILPIRGHDSVKEDVQKLYDALVQAWR